MKLLEPTLFDDVREMARDHYGWEDICVRLNLRSKLEKRSIRIMVLRGMNGPAIQRRIVLDREVAEAERKWGTP